MAADASYDERLRAAAFAHLDRLLARSPNGALRSDDVNNFEFEARMQRLIVQTGIWKPAGLDAALSIRTTYTPPTEARPYEDELGDDGFLRYKYRGTDPNHSDNRALREAMPTQAPLIYFVGIASGLYNAHYPVWIKGEDPEQLEFAVALDETQLLLSPAALTPAERQYGLALTRRRLHQPAF